MKQYILKSALVAEIERRIEFWHSKPALAPSPYVETECKSILSFLNTLEVKEVEEFIWNNARTTVPEDSTNQIICIKEDGLAVSTIGKIVNGTVKWAYLDDLLNTNSFNAEVKEVDLEKEVRSSADQYDINNSGHIYWEDIVGFAKHFYELGLKAQKGE